MSNDQSFFLRWNSHHDTLVQAVGNFLSNKVLADCTLAAEGQHISAHRLVLCACSPYLERMLNEHYEKHPIVMFSDIDFQELKSIVDYMYKGEVNVSQNRLEQFIKAAKALQIKGLVSEADSASRTNDINNSAIGNWYESDRTVLSSFMLNNVPESEMNEASKLMPTSTETIEVEDSVGIKKNCLPHSRHRKQRQHRKLTANEDKRSANVDSSSDVVVESSISLVEGSVRTLNPASSTTKAEDLYPDNDFKSTEPDDIVVFVESKFNSEIILSDYGEESVIEEKPVNSNVDETNLIEQCLLSNSINHQDDTYLNQRPKGKHGRKRTSRKKSLDLYPCPNECGRTYKNKYSLHRHVSVECGREKTLQCPYCLKGYYYKREFDRHMQTHQLKQ